MALGRDVIREGVVKLHRLSTVPRANERIMSVILDERSDAAAVAVELARDQAVTARVLRLVNSAYYGFYRQIASVKEAVTILGFNEIRRLVLTTSVFDSLRRFGGRLVPRNYFWEHSLACAAAADILNTETGAGLQAPYFAGLLHDIGKIVLDEFYPEAFERAFALSAETGRTLDEAEREVMETDHAEVGYWLTERWNIPLPISHAVLYHHAPDTCESPKSDAIVALVWAANRLARLAHSDEVPPIAASELLTSGALDRARGELLRQKSAIMNFSYAIAS